MVSIPLMFAEYFMLVLSFGVHLKTQSLLSAFFASLLYADRITELHHSAVIAYGSEIHFFLMNHHHSAENIAAESVNLHVLIRVIEYFPPLSRSTSWTVSLSNRKSHFIYNQEPESPKSPILKAFRRFWFCRRYDTEQNE